VFATPQALHAQMTGAPAAGYKREPGITSSTMPAALREIGFDQFIDQSIPLDVPFRDESGRTVQLGDYFGKRPVVLVFAYYDCPMLCTLVINGLSTALNVRSLEPSEEFEIVTVSFNPKDTPATAAAKKAIYLERYKRGGRRRLALPDRRSGVDRSADGSPSGMLGREDQSVRIGAAMCFFLGGWQTSLRHRHGRAIWVRDRSISGLGRFGGGWVQPLLPPPPDPAMASRSVILRPRPHSPSASLAWRRGTRFGFRFRKAGQL
jgi:hypothetical protein